MPIHVIKRSGARVPLDISKIQRQVAHACRGVDGVSASMIEIRAQIQFHDGMKTSTIDELLLKAMVDLIDESENPEINNVNYQYVAGRQRVSMLRKEVYGDYDPPKLYDIVRRNVDAGMYTPELLEWYTEDEWNIIDLFLDHSKDEQYTYSAIAQLCEKYLVQNRSNGRIYETPQVRYAVAAATAFHAEPKDKRLKYVKDYYECSSEGHFTLATPVLAGLGTTTKQFSSCFPAGQLVWTTDGEKPIENIKVGESVLTHDGSYQKVLATRVQSASQDYLVKINNVYSLNGEFESTDDHLIMALKKNHPNSRKKYNVPQWVPAGQIEKGDFVQIPYSRYIDPRKKIKLSEEFPDILEYLIIDEDGLLRKPTTDPQQRSGKFDDKVAPFTDTVSLTPNLFRLLGYYAAEGHANKNTHSVGFTLSSKEEHYLNDIRNIIEADFKLHVTVNPRTDNSTSLTINSYALKALLTGLVDNGFDTKKLHDIVMKASKEHQEQFLIGVIRGDGCVTKNGLSLGMSNRHLIRQISQIMIRCNLNPVMGVVTAEKINEYKENRKKIKSSLEKNIITRKDCYKITMGISGNLEFLRRVDKNNKLTNSPRMREKSLYSKVVDGMYFAKVTSVEKRKANGIKVYDLQVNNVQSFTVNGVGVHNCVLISVDDTLDSIFAAGEMMAKYASKRAGIGLEIGRIRPLGAPIRNGEIKHTGLVPFLKKWYGDLRSCSQGGIRNASCTVTLPIWHYQFEDFIVLKNNQGTEETRVRQMDYSIVISKLFWRRYKNGENITLFDPHEVPDLYEAYYRDPQLFESLYTKYEVDTTKKRKVLSAEEIFKNGILKERTDTGRIYIINIDNIINQGSFDCTIDPVYQSNLCMEITLPNKPFQRLEDESGRIALCTLGSLNWGSFKNPQDMRKACRILVRSLSNLLNYQDFLSIQSKLANEDFEPLGVGVTNLAYWHARRNLKYGSEEALAGVKKFMEHQAYYLTEASIELAEERGACGRSEHTWYGKGVFPWERRASGVNELADFSPTLDWEALRARMLRSGIRNATLMAIAPVESSSVVLNSTNGIELPMELISVKESKAGSFVQVVPEYKRLKNRYQLMWEQTDCVDYLKTAAVLGVYVDQSISTNTFYNPAHYEGGKVPATLIAKNLMLHNYWGGKTVYYSLINKIGAKSSVSSKENDNVIAFAPVIEELAEEACEACKL